MKRVVYYHLYVTDNTSAWASVALEQLKAMEDSNLLSAIDKLVVVPIVKTQEDISNVSDLLRTEFNTPGPLRVEVRSARSNFVSDADMLASLNDESRAVTELITLKGIYDDCWQSKEEMQVCYVHSKGITSYCKPDNMENFKKYYYWRQFLNWGVITNWKKCTDALASHDVAGVGFYETPTPHFSGGFWWANSQYIRSIPDPTTDHWWKAIKEKTKDSWLKTCPDRFKDEMWLCSSGKHEQYPSIPVVFNLVDIPQHHNAGSICLPSSYYKGLI